MLDVAEDDRRTRDGERDAGDQGDEQDRERDRDPSVARTRGRNAKLRASTATSMTAKATRFVATDDNGTS